MNRIYLLLFFLIIFISSNSQSSGFLGRKTVISYGFNTSPALFEASKNNTTVLDFAAGGNGTAETGDLAFNALHELAIEHANSNKWMMGINAKYYKTAYDNNYDIKASTILENYKTTIRKYYSITGYNIGLYFKYFGTRYVAPWGRYMMFGPLVNFSTATYDPKMMNIKGSYKKYNSIYSSNYTTTDTIYSDFGPTTQKFTRFDIMVGWGRSRIISNRVVVDFGATAQCISLGTIIFDILDTNSQTPYRTGYIEKTEKIRVRGVNRFNVFLKIGILL